MKWLKWSGHKSLYEPYGIAGIAFGTDWQPEPLLYGGTGTVSESVDMPEEGVSLFEAGSQN
jgi:selenocysteine lyase/cysteine desulfurase